MANVNPKTPKEIAKILDGLSGSDVNALNKAFLSSLSGDVVKYLKSTDIYDSEGNDTSDGKHYVIETKKKSFLYRLNANAQYLSKDFISKMSLSELMTLSGDAVRALTKAQIQSISDSVFQERFNETYVSTDDGSRHNKKQKDELFFGNFSDFSKFTDHQISLFSAAHFAYSSSSALLSLTKSQIRAISADTIHMSGKLQESHNHGDYDTFESVDFITKLGSGVKYLTAEQVTSIRKDTFTRLDTAQLADINMTMLSSEFIRGLGYDTVSRLGKKTLEYFSKETLAGICDKLGTNAKYLTLKQVESLSTESLDDLREEAVAALTKSQILSLADKWAKMSTKDGSFLSQLGANAAYLSPSAAQVLSAKQLDDLNSTAVAALTPDFIAAIRSSIIDDLKSTDISDYSGDDLSYGNHYVIETKKKSFLYRLDAKAQYLTNEFISKMSLSELMTLSGDAVRALTKAQIQSISDSVFQERFNETYVHTFGEEWFGTRFNLSNKKQKGELFFGNFSDFSKFTDHQISLFSAAHFAYSSSSALLSLTKSQIRAISASTIRMSGKLQEPQDYGDYDTFESVDFITKLGSGVKYLTAEQVTSIRKDTFTRLDTAQLADINMTMLSSEFIRDLGRDIISHLTRITIEGLTYDQIAAVYDKLGTNAKYLTLKHVESLSTENLDDLREEAVAALTKSQILSIADKWEKMSTKDGGFLSQLGANAAYLSPSVAQVLSAKQLDVLNSTAVAALTPDFIAAMKPSELKEGFIGRLDKQAAYLTTGQLRDLQLNDLSVEGIGSLKDLSTVSADALNDLSKSQSKAITQPAFRTITPEVIAQLGYKEDGLIDQLDWNASFTKEQAAALSVEQFNRLSSAAIGAIKDISGVSYTDLSSIDKDATNALSAEAVHSITTDTLYHFTHPNEPNAFFQEDFFNEIGSSTKGFDANQVSYIITSQWDRMSFEAINNIQDLSQCASKTLDDISEKTTESLSAEAISTITVPLIQAMSNSSHGFFAELGRNASGFTQEQYNALDQGDFKCMSSVARGILYTKYGHA